MVPPAAVLINANCAAVGSEPKVTFAEEAMTLELEVTKASVISAVLPVMVRAPEQVTVPPVLAPIADSTVAATLPVSVIVTSAFPARLTSMQTKSQPEA